MPSDYEITKAMVEAIIARPSFHGFVLFYDTSDGEPKYGALAKSKAITNPQVAHLVQSVVERLETPAKMSTEELIRELRGRPGFNGVIVQEHGAEAEQVRGFTEVQFDVAHLEPKRAAEVLRTAADRLDHAPPGGGEWTDRK